MRMKRILPYLLVGFVGCFSACDSSKKSTEKQEKVVEESSKSTVLEDIQTLENGSSLGHGVVTNKHREEGCSFLVVATKNGEEVILHPANLNEEFKKDGLKVQIQYRLTRQPNTDGCHKGLFVEIEEITTL